MTYITGPIQCNYNFPRVRCIPLSVYYQTFECRAEQLCLYYPGLGRIVSVKPEVKEFIMQVIDMQLICICMCSDDSTLFQQWCKCVYDVVQQLVCTTICELILLHSFISC